MSTKTQTVRLKDSDLICVCRNGLVGSCEAEIREEFPAGMRVRRLPHVVRHSPTGFEYGYGGSGPADLALSILAACVGADMADRLYQDFKWRHVASRTEPEWRLTVGEVRAWVRAQASDDEILTPDEDCVERFDGMENGDQ